MYTSAIITALTSLLALASAAPAAKREEAVVDVTVQSSPLYSDNLQASAIQVIIGEPKVCIGNNGFSPCQASKLSISPWGNTVDITNVVCQGFSDTEGNVPISGWFVDNYPAILSTTGTEPVGSVVCDYIW